MHAQLRRAPPSMSLDPFLEKYDVSFTDRVGAGLRGIVYFVRRKNSSGYFAAKFLDPMFYRRNSKGFRILEALDHDCVIKLVESFPPYQPPVPAPSRQGPYPSSILHERKERVLILPAYDMDMRRLLRLRAASPQDFPEVHRASICKDIFCGLEYLHDCGILHRDIKPANIFVRCGEKVRAVIDVGLGAMMAPRHAAGVAHIIKGGADGHVGIYAAPELLRSCPVYGFPADVWSAGVVLFEIATLEPFLPGAEMTLNGIEQRIGPPPPEVGVMAVGSDGLNAHLRGNWLPLGLMCLDWLPGNRATAAALASHGLWDWGAASGDREDRNDLFLVSPSQTPPVSCPAASSDVDIPPASCTAVAFASDESSDGEIPAASCAAGADTVVIDL